MARQRTNLAAHRTVRQLQLAALLRNICQGIAAVDVSLYLKSLGWTGLAIGGALAMAGVVRSVLTVFAGEIQRQLGSRRYILIYELIGAAAALILTLTTNAMAMCIAIGIAGFGRGHSGSGGPVSPIERAWLGAYARRGDEKTAHDIFGVHAAVGYLGMGIGAILAGLPSLFTHWWSSALAYQCVFAITTLISLACAFVIFRVAGGARKPSTPTPPSTDSSESTTRRLGDFRSTWGGLFSVLIVVAVTSVVTARWSIWLPHLASWRPGIPIAILFILTGGRWFVERAIALVRAAPAKPNPARKHASDPFVNLINSVAVVLSSTMTSYWLSVRFHASEGLIGLVVAASYFAAGCIALMNVRISGRFGAINALVYLQVVGALLVFALPLVPWFWAAALLNLCAVGLNLGSRGSRSMLTATGPKHPRSWQRKLSSIVILTLTTGAWPAAFGQMMEEDEYVLPFFIAGSAQLLSAVWFKRNHRAELK